MTIEDRVKEWVNLDSKPEELRKRVKEWVSGRSKEKKEAT